MLLGSGYPQRVDVWSLGVRGARVIDQRLVNPDGERCWLPGVECMWRQNGVWDLNQQGEPHLLRPDHFSQIDGKPVDVSRDYFNPFANRYARAIREVFLDTLIFLESDPRNGQIHWGDSNEDEVVFAPHWYDGYGLFLKDFKSFIAFDVDTDKLVFGQHRIRKSFAEQLGRLKQFARTMMGDVPTLIGVFGIAFDLNNRRAYRTRDFRSQIAALDRSMRAMEDNLLSCTLWNYTADNDNQHGDQWNGEDLSIFSRNQQDNPADIHSGGRALDAAVRPYPIAVAGEPIRLEFDIRDKQFAFEFHHDPDVTAPTEIYVPSLQYPAGFQVILSDGTYSYAAETQTLRYMHDPSVRWHTIQIRP